MRESAGRLQQRGDSANTTARSDASASGPNVLVLESTFEVGGVENLLYNVFTRLDAARDRVTFVSLYAPGPLGEQLVDSGYRLEHSLIRSKYDLLGGRALCRIVRRDRIDVIYIATQPLTLFWGLLVAKMVRLPVACLIGNMMDSAAHRKLHLQRLLLKRVDAIVAQTESHRKHLVDSEGLPTRLIRVIHNGVDTAPFRTGVARAGKLASIGLPPHSKIVGLNGRMVALKGIDVFLQAARLLIASGMDLYFVLVGAGEEMQRFEALSAALGLAGRTRFLGFRDDLPQLTQLYDVAVLASRIEACPMVLMEYMAAGRPVACTNVGGVGDLVRHEVEALLVEPEDAASLAVAIRRFLSDPELAGRCARNGKSAVDGFGIVKTAESTNRLLVELARESA